ncbi:MAG: type II toxin-antitoxin system death-on-curing family toxin [Bryobacteraceae bacterium]
MKEPGWIRKDTVYAIHDAQLAEHGGSDGVRDAGLIESALARAQNAYAYNKRASVSELAAAYCYGLAKNHGFVDGNKRVAAVVCELFLELNGYRLTAGDADWLTVMLALADGSLEEAALAEWLKANVARVGAGRAG